MTTRAAAKAPGARQTASTPGAEADAAKALDAAHRRARELLRRWSADPARFAWDVFRVRLWRRQVEICHAVARHRRVAVRSGHKIGKSVCAAILALWWVVTRPKGRVVMTAPTGAQIRGTLWLEVTRLVEAANERLASIGGFGGTLHKLPELGLQLGPGHEVIGRATNRQERMAGTSGADLLYIVDEASGVDQKIFETIEGNLTGGGRLVLFSNPTQTSGEFFDAFHTKRALYHCIAISGEETPNVVAGRAVVEGLATREAILERRVAWGPDYLNDPRYQVRVLGQFPRQAAYAVVPLGLVEQARARWQSAPESGALELGVDVARFGDDDSVIFPRRGLRAYRPRAIHGFDTVEVAGATLHLAKGLRHSGERVRVKVDVIGYGAGVADILRHAAEEQGLDWLTVVDVNSSRSADGGKDDDYVNLRAELAFGVTEWLKAGGAFEPDERLEQELVAANYAFDGKGRCKVESKDEIKKRLGRSPDCADALALAVYEAGELVVHDHDEDEGDEAYRFGEERGFG